jgi:signal transduction histidine kinase/DNA-binding response OmpR family regulator
VVGGVVTEGPSPGFLFGLGRVLLVTGVVFSFFYAWVNAAPAAAACAAATTVCGWILWRLRRGDSAQTTAQRYLGTFYFALTTVAFATGGHRAPVGVWLSLVPLVAVSVSGLRSAQRWGWIVAATMTVLFVLDRLGIDGSHPGTIVLPRLEQSVEAWVLWVGNVGLVLVAVVVVGRYERAMRDLLARLEQSREALSIARDQAEAASRAKSTFLANVSHEVRTPLNGIIGLSEVLRESEAEPDRRQQLDVVRNSARSLLAVLNDVLDFSKIESGALALESLPFVPGDVVDEVVELFGPPAESRGLLLAAHIEDRTLVQGDPVRFRQIVSNLVGNAVKFTTAGWVHVRLRSSETAQGRCIVLEVEDSGIGISEDQLARVFSPFAQADVATTRRFGGTGLGLSIVQQLCGAMGGRIDVQSAIGRGTSFRLVFPWRVPSMSPRPIETGLEGRVFAVVLPESPVRDTLCENLWRAGAASVSIWPDLESFAIAREDFSATGAPPIEEIVLTSSRRALALEQPMAARWISVCGAHPAAGRGAPVAHVSSWVRGARFVRRIVGALEPDALITPTLSEPILANATPDNDVGEGLSVLVAEDNPVNQQVIARMLRRLGATADFVENGRLAVEAVQRRTYDVVLMDGQMPVLDGEDATREIRNLPGPAGRVTVVAVTAHTLQGDQSRCFAAGMDDHVPKPLTLDALRVTLERVRARRDLAEDARAEFAGVLAAVLPTMRQGSSELVRATDLSLEARESRLRLAVRRLAAGAAWSGDAELERACRRALAEPRIRVADLATLGLLPVRERAA